MVLRDDMVIGTVTIGSRRMADMLPLAHCGEISSSFCAFANNSRQRA